MRSQTKNNKIKKILKRGLTLEDYDNKLEYEGAGILSPIALMQIFKVFILTNFITIVPLPN